MYNDENYQYAFLRYLQNYDINEFNFQKIIKSKLHTELENIQHQYWQHIYQK